jgi:hypothetical protein
VAVIQIRAETSGELEAALARLGVGVIVPGSVLLRSLGDVDTGIVSRWDELSVLFMPHGGQAVIRELAAALEMAGLSENRRPSARDAYPEAGSEVEAKMLEALARARSPLAIDLLLDQPRRWAVPANHGAPSLDDPRLRRLIDPPLVAALGSPNIGKSSLANALADRRVAIVADEPGTTRDHVGVMIDMAGLVVRYVDTPGVRATTDPIDATAAALAREVISRADLVLRCGDATAGPLEAPPGVPSLIVALRSDLGPPSWKSDIPVSATTGGGLHALAERVRDTLVPAALRADPRPWRFWE